MSVASPEKQEEKIILERLAEELPKMDKTELIKWVSSIADDMLKKEGGFFDEFEDDYPSTPPHWGFDVVDVAEDLAPHNRYAVIYVIIHRLLFCNIPTY